MSSTNRTPKLGLCDWIGTDVPLREDFCSDNRVIDEALGGHLADRESHLSEKDREKLSLPVLGTYTGDGAQERTVSLGFAPRMGFIFPLGDAAAPALYAPGLGYTACGLGFFCEYGGSLGVARSDSGFRVRHQEESAGADALPWLNRADTQYVYVVWQ